MVALTVAVMVSACGARADLAPSPTDVDGTVPDVLPRVEEPAEFVNACGAGDGAACERLMLRTAANRKKANAWGTKACDLGQGDACAMVATSLWLGTTAIVKRGDEGRIRDDIAEACRLTQTAVRLGRPFGQAIAICRRAREIGVPGADLDEIKLPVPSPRTGPNHASPVRPRKPAPVVEARMVAGVRRVRPPEFVVHNMAQSGRRKLHALIRVCIDEDGFVRKVSVRRSSGHPAYDALLFEAVRAWRYAPLLVSGVPRPVCTVVNFVYKLN